MAHDARQLLEWQVGPVQYMVSKRRVRKRLEYLKLLGSLIEESVLDIPLKEFDGVIALLRHPESRTTTWLVRRSPRTQLLHLLIAERLQNESARESIDRELSWQLRLNRGKDYLISSMARLNFQQTVVVPDRPAPISVRAEFLVVTPYGQSAAKQLLADAENYWLTRNELLTGRTESGFSVDPFAVALLNAADVINHPE